MKKYISAREWIKLLKQDRMTICIQLKIARPDNIAKPTVPISIGHLLEFLGDRFEAINFLESYFLVEIWDKKAKKFVNFKGEELIDALMLAVKYVLKTT